MLSVSVQAQRRERTDCGLADRTDECEEDVGLRSVLLAFAECEGVQMEPQACLPHLSRAGAEHADQAS